MQRLEPACALERQRPGEALVHHHAEREHVDTPVDRAAVRVDDLGRGVMRRAEECALSGPLFEALRQLLGLGDAEVEHLEEVGVADRVDPEAVGGLDVAMNDLLLVRGLQSSTGMEHHRREARPG